MEEQCSLSIASGAVPVIVGLPSDRSVLAAPTPGKPLTKAKGLHILKNETIGCAMSFPFHSSMMMLCGGRECACVRGWLQSMCM